MAVTPVQLLTHDWWCLPTYAAALLLKKLWFARMATGQAYCSSSHGNQPLPKLWCIKVACFSIQVPIKEASGMNGAFLLGDAWQCYVKVGCSPGLTMFASC